MTSTSSDSKLTMADLMAKYPSKSLTLLRGQEVEGEVMVITPTEIILDFGTKAEGVLPYDNFCREQLVGLKVGDRLRVFVAISENQFGQVTLSLDKMGPRDKKDLRKWQKFVGSLGRKTTFAGKVIEVNKGGLIVEVEGSRGFVPSSQIDLNFLNGLSELSQLSGKNLNLTVIEVDPGANRLIFSGRQSPLPKDLENLAQFKVGEEVGGQVAAIMPFGLFVWIKVPQDLVEGIVFPQEVSWEEGDFTKEFKVNQEIKAKVIGKDEHLGRFNLSIRQLTADPLAKLLDSFQVDDVVTGMVTEITQNGVFVKLDEGIQGFIPAEKVGQDSSFQLGQTTNFLVDSVDKAKRRVNLAPFLTSTKGLIYK